MARALGSCGMLEAEVSLRAHTQQLQNATQAQSDAGPRSAPDALKHPHTWRPPAFLGPGGQTPWILSNPRKTFSNLEIPNSETP